MSGGGGGGGVQHFLGNIFGGNSGNSRQHRNNSDGGGDGGGGVDVAADLMQDLLSFGRGLGLGGRPAATAAAERAHRGSDSRGGGGGAQAPSPWVESAAPPASAKILRQLPVVKVRPADLVDPTNRECCICLDEIVVHRTVTRLPCAHLFHSHCIGDWLQYHRCTCPVCRYELPTDDANYEVGRLQRMRLRKPRFARHELERLSVTQLKQLLQPPQPQHKQSRRSLPGHIMDKTALVEYVIAVGAVDLVPAAEDNDGDLHVAYTLAQLQTMSVKRLKHVMNEEAGVFFDPKDVLEKADMIQIFVLSGRLEVLPEISSVGAEENDGSAEEDQKPAATAAVSMASDSSERGTDGIGRKPAACSSFSIETVYSDAEEEDHDDKVAAAPVVTIGPRVHTDLIMEENLAFVAAEPRVSAAAVEPPPSPTVFSAPDATVTTRKTSMPPGKDASTTTEAVRETNESYHGSVLASSNIVSPTEADATQESREAQSSSTASAFLPSTTPTLPLAPNTSINDDMVAAMRERFMNMNMQDLQKLASDLQVDVSEYMAQRECLDRTMAGRLASAAAAATKKQSGFLNSFNNPNVTVLRDFTQPAPQQSGIINDSIQFLSDDDPTPKVAVPSLRPQSIKRRRVDLLDDFFDYNYVSSADPNFIRSSNNNTGPQVQSLSSRAADPFHSRSIADRRSFAAQDHPVVQIGDNECCATMSPLGMAEAPATLTASASANGNDEITDDEEPETGSCVLSDSLFEEWGVSEILALAALVDVDLSSASSDRDAMLDALRASSFARPHVARYLHALAPLAALTIPQLQAVAREWQVPVSDCIEKGEILHRLIIFKTAPFR